MSVDAALAAAWFRHVAGRAEIDAGFDDPLCEPVAMHLRRETIATTGRSLARITGGGGGQYRSRYVTKTADGADQIGDRDQRYACCPATLVTDALNGMQIVNLGGRTSRSSGEHIAIAVARNNN
jgi:hypothetical protein